MNKNEKKFIEKNVELLKALLEQDTLKLKDVRRAMEESLSRLTTLPPDHVMTRAIIRRAKWLAEDANYKYICPTCHKGFDKKDDLLRDVEDHVLDFYDGIPPRMAPAYIKKLKQMIPKRLHHRLKYRKEKDAIDIDKV